MVNIHIYEFIQSQIDKGRSFRQNVTLGMNISWRYRIKFFYLRPCFRENRMWEFVNICIPDWFLTKHIQILFFQNKILNEITSFCIFGLFSHVEWFLYSCLCWARLLDKFKYTWQVFKFDFLENEAFNVILLFLVFVLFCAVKSPVISITQWIYDRSVYV